jgi:hypothetical protein
MPAELTWDSPLVFYDGSASWDGFSGPTRTAMNNIKAVINFETYSAPELGPIAQIIHDKMLLNVLIFTDPTVTMVNLQTLVTTYDQKLLARASRAKADVIAFNEAREALEEGLTRLGNYVNSVALGDASVVEKSGFPSYSTEREPDENPPSAPTNLRLTQGELSGTFLARYKPDRRNSSNEVQTCTGDPNNAADWHTKGIFRGGRAELDGVTPGTVVWVRVRTVGLKGVMGSWSDPAQIRVL